MIATTAEGESAAERRLAWNGAFAVAALVAVMVGAFAGAMLYFTEGHLSPPLDDTYIYFQYARQIAHGQVFVYVDGDPATSGSTSFIYPFTLASGYLAGFRGEHLVVFGVALGAVFLAAAALLTYRLAREMMDETPAWTAALLVAVNGWLGWTFFGMMESGLHTVALLGALVLFLRAHKSMRDLAFFSAGLFALPFCRPELSVIGPAIALYWACARLFDAGARPQPLTLAVPVLASIAGGVAYFGAMVAITGAARTDTYVVQSLLANEYTTWAYKAERILSNFWSHLDFSFGFLAPWYLRFGAAMLALAGACAFVAGDLRQRRPTVASLIPLLAVAGILSASLEDNGEAHYHRWAAPYAPFIVLLVVRGTAEIVARLRRRVPAARFGWQVAAALLLLAAIPSAFAAREYGRAARDIHFQQTQAAFWLRENTPATAIVALNDAGAIAYYGQRRIYDVIGLVTQGAAESLAEGTASSWERIERLPPEERPTVYAIYPLGLFAEPEFGFLHRVTSFKLEETTVAGAPEKVIFEPDNSLFGTGDEPRELPADGADWRVMDRLDVADIASEAEHGYASRQLERNTRPVQALVNATYAGDGSRVADGGRLNTRETFTLRAEAGASYVVVMRVFQQEAIDVVVRGPSVHRAVQLPATAGAWRDIVVAEGKAPADGTIWIELEASGGRYRSFSYWLLQP